MIKTKGTVHFTIPVSDLTRSEDFYVDILGMEVVQRVPEMVFLKTGDDIVILAKSKTPIEPNKDEEPLVHHAFLIDPGTYEDATAYLKSKGVRIVHEEDRHSGAFPGKQAYFLDPDRNCLEVIDLRRSLRPFVLTR